MRPRSRWKRGAHPGCMSMDSHAGPSLDMLHWSPGSSAIPARYISGDTVLAPKELTDAGLFPRVSKPVERVLKELSIQMQRFG